MQEIFLETDLTQSEDYIFFNLYDKKAIAVKKTQITMTIEIQLQEIFLPKGLIWAYWFVDLEQAWQFQQIN